MVKLAASKRYQLKLVKETSSSCSDNKVDKQELIARRAQHEPSNVDLDYKPWREDGDFSDNSYDESERADGVTITRSMAGIKPVWLPT